MLGVTEARLFTPPLRELTPETSYGFDVIEFARDVLETPLDPWQEWLVIHMGELLPDGRPRFRRVLVLVARQNGKTFLLKVLTLYWLFVEQQKLVLGTSTSREKAIETWNEALDAALDNDLLAAEFNQAIRASGRQCFDTIYGCKYKVAATNRKTGRGSTLNRLIMDELREHHNREAYNAAVPAMNAVRTAQMFGISNQGDDKSVILNELREAALLYLETGKGDRRLGIFEWSSPQGSLPTDVYALAHANPGIGYRIDIESILGEAQTAQIAGGKQLADFKTEVMCQRVHVLDPGIDPDAWARNGTDNVLDLAEHRQRVALCLDVSLDGSHSSLVAAAQIDGIVWVDVVKTWDGYGHTKLLRQELPGIVAKVKPRIFGYFPKGPAAALIVALEDRKENKVWPPRGIKVEELTAELASVCMGLADLVDTDELRHMNDPLLTQHVHQAQKLRRVDTWVFTRRGVGAIDGAYALAGAVHLARKIPASRSALVAL